MIIFKIVKDPLIIVVVIFLAMIVSEAWVVINDGDVFFFEKENPYYEIRRNEEAEKNFIDNGYEL